MPFPFQKNSGLPSARPIPKKPPAPLETPRIRQRREEDNGTTALSMVLQYLGVPLDPEGVRQAIGLDPAKKASVNDVYKGAMAIAKSRPEDHLGVAASKLRKSTAAATASAMSSLSLPLILTWNKGEFAVLEEVKEGAIRLNLPAQGVVTVTEDQLEEGFADRTYVSLTRSKLCLSTVKTPAIKVKEDQVLGGALAILLAYWKVPKPVEKLQELVNTYRASDIPGVKLLETTKDLVSGMRGKYLHVAGQTLARGAQKDLLDREPPFIVVGEDGEAMVVEGCEGGRVLVNDPLHGHAAAPEDEFFTPGRWRNVISMMHATPDWELARTPTVLQMEAVECGAASTAMILGYFNRWETLENLRVLCGVSRDGSKGRNLERSARNDFGFDARFRNPPFESSKDLYGLKPPFIAYWNASHWLVVDGFKKGMVYLNDPATGARSVTEKEFERGYTFRVITYDPTETFRSGGSPPTLWPGLLARLKPFWGAVGWVVFWGLLLFVPGVLIPTFSRVFIDEYLVDGKKNWVIPLIIGMGITAVARGFFTHFQEYLLLQFQAKLAIRNSRDFFGHVLRLPVEFFSQRFVGEVANRVELNTKIAKTMTNEFAKTVIDMCVAFFYILIMLMYDVWLTLIVVISTIANFLYMKYVSKGREQVTMRLLREMGKVQGTASNGFNMIETIKATGGEAEFFNRISGEQVNSLNAKQKISAYAQGSAIIPGLIDKLTEAVVLFVGGMLIMEGKTGMTVGALVAFQSLNESFNKPVANFVKFGDTFQELGGQMNRVDDVWNYPQDEFYARDERAKIQVNEDGTPRQKDGGDLAEEMGITRLSGLVEFRHLTFGYSKLDIPLIQDFNLRIEPGQRVALVGGSGSGKSTMAKLLAGTFPIRPIMLKDEMRDAFEKIMRERNMPPECWTGGKVMLDGIPRNEVPGWLLTNSLAVVDQEVFLFEGTVRDNVAMWDKNIEDSEIMRALEDACIADIIASKPGGLDYQIQEGGTNFSGGQRQRIEIARALVRRPSILILDEATSALDSNVERVIDENIRKRGCSCLIVAHRLSTVKDSDVIVVLTHGREVERGTHEELRKKGGTYARLIQDDH
jgi:ABC-type bacteriocin/lantibiotic exporter with double-glycine peptidase domain